MEEIDIIELLQRVKEGKAPKEIEIEDTKYFYNQDDDICRIYEAPNEKYHWLVSNDITLDTKIKILDKPKYQIITKVSDDWDYDTVSIYDLCSKVDEVIDYINNKENKDE